jgi:hypothetical protein
LYLASKYLKEPDEKLGKLLGIGLGIISIIKEEGRFLCNKKGSGKLLF